MSERQPTNLWDFQNHPEWQDAFDNGTNITYEQAPASPVITIDPAKLSADALRFNQFVLGSDTYDKIA